ncbi:hypothetical protein N7462_002731 [Penicillium macrosclerotiorum]|uniref:uncharacterized protein n=1 Tax=Penicillium macrosclerotiorum TaxID=303699 RepID=UPI002546E1F0|nr:uncharacterized protein N7462_002731 [Penicillium macrosclerotiorum]KAJ5693308.1 hypothetical protein N7462_002731 [Penicillium macrosclerotiorum]
MPPPPPDPSIDLLHLGRGGKAGRRGDGEPGGRRGGRGRSHRPMPNGIDGLVDAMPTMVSGWGAYLEPKIKNGATAAANAPVWSEARTIRDDPVSRAHGLAFLLSCRRLSVSWAASGPFLRGGSDGSGRDQGRWGRRAGQRGMIPGAQVARNVTVAGVAVNRRASSHHEGHDTPYLVENPTIRTLFSSQDEVQHDTQPTDVIALNVRHVHQDPVLALTLHFLAFQGFPARTLSPAHAAPSRRLGSCTGEEHDDRGFRVRRQASGVGNPGPWVTGNRDHRPPSTEAGFSRKARERRGPGSTSIKTRRGRAEKSGAQPFDGAVRNGGSSVDARNAAVKSGLVQRTGEGEGKERSKQRV